MLEALPIPVLVVDPDHRIVFANTGFHNAFGVLEGTLVGRILWECWSAEKFASVKEAYDEVFRTRQNRVVDHRSVELGHDFELWFNWAGGHVIVACVDVTVYVRQERLMQVEFQAIKSIMDGLQAANSEAVNTAHTDDLTGLCTRRRAEEIASRVFPALAERNLPVSVILFDIDHFKDFNDNFGHLEGDRILSQVGAAMNAFKTELETAARYGGEEFLFICPRAGVRRAVARATEFLEVLRTLPGTVAPVSASFGVAGIGREETDWTHTLARADKALYLAKSRGRGRVVPWTSVNDSADTFKEAA